MKVHPDDKAFPVPDTVAKLIDGGYGFPDEYLGLTKREYFAVKILSGMISNQMVFDMSDAQAAMFAVKSADALIAELNKE